MTASEDKIPRIVRNEFFYAIARLCMIATIPLLGFVLQKANDIADTVAKQNVALQLITQEVHFRFANVDDHEQRLRRLELADKLEQRRN